MNERIIDLNELTPHGRAEMKLENGILNVRATRSVAPYSSNLYGDSYRKHYVSLPGRYRLPFRLDMTVRLDYPSLYLFVGGGHITFATPRRDNRKIEDIAKPSGKPNQDGRFYDNSLPYGELTDISVTYGFDEMQIIINGEERFYSRKQAYMKAKDLSALNEEGFTIGLAVAKLSALGIKTIKMTEYDGKAPVVRGAFEEIPHSAEAEKAKPDFEGVILGLPPEIKGEIVETDKFLTALRPMKFKRAVDKNGSKISYVASDFGVSYAFNISGLESSQNLGWYIVTGGKPETWHRKADFMEKTLAFISETDPALAGRMFYALSDCVGCFGGGCLGATLYSFNGEKKAACHGRITLRMCREDFEDAREFIRHINALMETEVINGNLPFEKISLKNNTNAS
jgi:hypothetical protein